MSLSNHNFHEAKVQLDRKNRYISDFFLIGIVRMNQDYIRRTQPLNPGILWPLKQLYTNLYVLRQVLESKHVIG